MVLPMRRRSSTVDSAAPRPSPEAMSRAAFWPSVAALTRLIASAAISGTGKGGCSAFAGAPAADDAASGWGGNSGFGFLVRFGFVFVVVFSVMATIFARCRDSFLTPVSDRPRLVMLIEPVFPTSDKRFFVSFLYYTVGDARSGRRDTIRLVANPGGHPKAVKERDECPGKVGTAENATAISGRF